MISDAKRDEVPEVKKHSGLIPRNVNLSPKFTSNQIKNLERRTNNSIGPISNSPMMIKNGGGEEIIDKASFEVRNLPF